MADNKHYNQRNNNPSWNGYFSRKEETELDPYEGYACKGNLGLLFTRRYYGEINLKVLDKASIRLEVITKKRTGEQVRKEIPTDHQTLYYKSRNKNIINQAKQFVTPESDQMPTTNVTPLELTTTYTGLLTGVGIPHAAKHNGEAMLGLVFDHTTGLPYIPGSSIKGLLRSLFPLQDLALADKLEKKADDKDVKQNDAALLKKKALVLREKAGEKSKFITSRLPPDKKLSDQMIEALEKSIFIGLEYNKENNCYEPSSKRDIFFDAFPSNATNGLLGLDYITPHTKGEFVDPTPIQFMRINPGVTFRFPFTLHDTTLPDGTTISKSDKRQLFSAILTTVGIGAKTNVGYGQLKASDGE